LASVVHIVAEARKAYSDPEIRREAIEMAEELLPLDKEAPDIAEGRRPRESGPEESGDRWRKQCAAERCGPRISILGEKKSLRAASGML